MKAIIVQRGINVAEPEQTWRSKWDEECPLTIGVALQNWELWSDSVLRDELKRIRETGFQTVRVKFNRDTDIEKSPGMVNWRNPDRFFDAAERAGLRVWCAPGNEPHPALRTSIEASTRRDNALADITRWIGRFVRQYAPHPTLLAWTLETGGFLYNIDDTGFRTEARFMQEQAEGTALMRAFAEADSAHPVLIQGYFPPAPITYDLKAVGLDASNALFGIPGQGNLTPTAGYLAQNRGLYIQAKTGIDSASPRLSALYDFPTGTSIAHKGPVTMTPGKITRMLLTMLAAGAKSIFFDQWKSGEAGDFTGQGGFVDWLNRVTPAAQTTGQIAQAVERWRQELWHSEFFPQVQVFCPFMTELSQRVGVACALLNANVPFAFLTERELGDATRPHPSTLFMPGQQHLDERLLPELKTLVENGTRLITELPTGSTQLTGGLLDTRPGSLFEQLFGASIAGMFYVDAPNPNDAPTAAQLRAQIVTTTARAGGGSGEVPAFTENRVGKGRALLINLPLSQINADANLPNAQLSLLSYILGSRQTELPGLTGCLQFRRTSQNAEHVFLINDSAEERAVSISVPASYTNVTDVLADTALVIAEGSVSAKVPAGSGSWLRLSTSA